MKNAIGDVMEKIGETFAEAFGLSGRANRIKGFAENFWANYGAPIHNAFVAIRAAANTAWDGMMAGFRAVGEYIGQVLTPFQENFGSAFKTIVDHIDVMLGSWEGFRDGVIQLSLQTTYALEGIWEHFKHGAIRVWRNFVNAAQLWLEGFRVWIDSVWGKGIQVSFGHIALNMAASLAGPFKEVVLAAGVAFGQMKALEATGNFADAQDLKALATAAWTLTENAVADVRKEIQKRTNEDMLAEDERYLEKQKKLAEEAGIAWEEWKKNLPGYDRASGKFKTAAEMAGMPGVPGAPGGAFGGGLGGGAAGAGGAGGFRMVSIAGLADTMQQEAGRRMAERTANATERTAASNEELLAIQREQAAYDKAYWSGAVATYANEGLGR